MSKEARNWYSRQIIPSQAYLARETGLTERAVRTALALLSEMGMVERRHRSAGAKGRISDSYTLRLHREFMFTRKQIKDTRNAIRYRNQIPVGDNSLPERGSFATGTSFRGIGDDQKEVTYQDKAIQWVDSSIGHIGGGVVVPLRKLGGAK
jgi:DNA-binding transcriptional MocR family regulator